MPLFRILPIEITSKYEVVLYSHEQKCYHIEALVEYLRSNIEDFILSDEWNGYQIIGIFSNYDEASDYILKCREIKNIKTKTNDKA